MQKELRDQTSHAIAAAVALLPAAISPNALTFAWAGFCLGLVREVTEEGAPVTVESVKAAVHSYRDLAFWTLGGFVTGWMGA